MERSFQNVPWPGWEIIKNLGHGNFGTVYRIQRTTRGRTEFAALKVISIPKDESEIAKLRQDDYDDESITQYYADCLNKIEDEYAMMAELKGYANIVYCDDYFSQPHKDGFGWDIYIKMELLTPLKEYLPAEIPEAQVVSLGIDICNALKRCEELNIVHRDIKPENIFVSKEGKYKLGDFGIARTMEGTTGGTKIGTFDYMAPEVNNSKAYHTEVDIYSLGLVMYWMLNERTGPFLPLGGKKPTPSMKQAAWDRRFAGEQIPAPKNGSEELKAIVLKACAYDPKERYQSAKNMLLALEALKTGTASVTESVPVAEPIPAEDVIVVEDLTVGPGWGSATEHPDAEENLTVGPGWCNTAEDPAEDVNMTVGPMWHKSSATANHDVTVGPVFQEKKVGQTYKIEGDEKKTEELLRNEQVFQEQMKNITRQKKRKWWIIATVVGIFLAIFLWCRPGWRTIDGEEYYYVGGKKVTGWQDIDGIFYCFDDYGRLYTGWQTYGLESSYICDGILQTGLQEINEKFYFFDENGIKQTGWQRHEGNTYYFNPVGVMQTGWQFIDGVQYCFDENGVLQHSLEWNAENGMYKCIDCEMMADFHLSSSGELLARTEYSFNDKGTLQKVQTYMLTEKAKELGSGIKWLDNEHVYWWYVGTNDGELMFYFAENKVYYMENSSDVFSDRLVEYLGDVGHEFCNYDHYVFGMDTFITLWRGQLMVGQLGFATDSAGSWYVIAHKGDTIYENPTDTTVFLVQDEVIVNELERFN